jgi:DNA-binding HxlR family transcriptional regulator
VAKRNALADDRRSTTRDRDGADKVGAASQLRPVKGSVRAADATPVDLDRLIHERMRLGIVSALAVNDSLTFNELKALMRTTDGNLSVHARKLEEAGYVACRKSFAGRMPRSDYSLTVQGRRALERYLEHMEALIKQTRDR